MKNLRLTVCLFGILGTAVSSSCSTTKGLGQDLQKVGSRMERKADESGGTAPEPSTSAPAVPYAY